MDYNEYKKKSIDELKIELEKLLKEKFELKMQRGSGLNPKPHLFRENKVNIARIKTLMNENKND
ncbi:MAG: 50S ribosomal protein L29 [Gammaproteobacteria bacterium]|nr:50S ribosomal protein L29 [Gammaproteobacteria bacterium]|tara:strand:+ start:2403 stop:2594 length:192 start_codon:yes stop_codon:yes gene_type:complete